MQSSFEVKTDGAFRFPPSLEPRHVEELKKRGISCDFALASGVRTAADNELRKLGFEASLPIDQRKTGLQGICFEYRDLTSREAVSWRLKPDQRFVIGEKPAKYISRVGDKSRAYFPHTTTAEMAANPKIQVLFTEGEFKTLALAERIVPIASRPSCVIGLQGVNGGWCRDRITVTLPTGEKETRKEGHAQLIEDLEAWEWKRRVVYVIFDSDVGGKVHAVAFKQNKRSGAWGAEYTLAQLLRAKGAEVRIIVIPLKLDGTKYGIDDLIAERGPHDVLKLIYNNWVVERDPDEVLYTEKRAAIRIEPLAELVRTAPAKPPEIVEAILPMGGVAIIGGASGIGKSLLAMNLCHAVATGGRFLDRWQARPGKVLYIQTEMPDWSLAVRAKHLSEISENFLYWSPGPSCPLNTWEQDGFHKRRETGNREIVMALLDQIKSHGIVLACFDPMSDFTSLSLTDPEAAAHLMDIFRFLARNAPAGILLQHHHRKTGGRESKYEGQDDIFGSYEIVKKADSALGMYAHKRADGTIRYKLTFSKLRHAAPIEDHEIERLSGGNCFGWRAFPWEDYTRGKLTPEDSIINALTQGRCDCQEAMRRSGLAKSTFFRTFSRLEKRKIVRRSGNLYYLEDEENEAENGN